MVSAPDLVAALYITAKQVVASPAGWQAVDGHALGKRKGRAGVREKYFSDSELAHFWLFLHESLPT
ncbi:hypothetical protein J7432_17885, partial [Xanthomonas axonopodis pv. begoniae]|nr:hypothetical protein [Xanthomonas axonopodis pv. begoniae]